MKKKYSGVLCHITSLPSGFGVGDFGPMAYDFIDKLKSAGQHYWQILPLGNTDDSGCPYATDSAFGCAEFLISPELLISEYGLKKNAFREYSFHSERVDFGLVKKNKREILEQAYLYFSPEQETYQQFLKDESDWIEDYCQFRAFSETRGDDFRTWGDDPISAEEKDLVAFHKFCQFTAFSQFLNLKKYANKNKVLFIGDLPIFVSYKSMDVWKNPEQFLLEKNLEMKFETGAAPDAFSETGQKWGTPMYNWQEQKKDQFFWWKKRLSFLKRYFDIVRIDHFRGFCATWISLKAEPDARNGHWYEGPRADLFHALNETPEIIAEDLGHITPDVNELRSQFHFPTMKVFEFLSADKNNPHHLKNYHFDSVAYTATHDCNTLVGWFSELSSENKKMVEAQIKKKNPTQWDMIEALMKTPSKMVLIQIQDILGLGSEARFNYPGTTSNANWTWLLTVKNYNLISWRKLKRLTEDNNRKS